MRKIALAFFSFVLVLPAASAQNLVREKYSAIQIDRRRQPHQTLVALGQARVRVGGGGLDQGVQAVDIQAQGVGIEVDGLAGGGQERIGQPRRGAVESLAEAIQRQAQIGQRPLLR